MQANSGSLVSTMIAGSCPVVLLRGWLVTVDTEIRYPISMSEPTQQGRVSIDKTYSEKQLGIHTDQGTRVEQFSGHSTCTLYFP